MLNKNGLINIIEQKNLNLKSMKRKKLQRN